MSTNSPTACSVAGERSTPRGEPAFAAQPVDEVAALRAQIAELEQFCGQLTLENKLLQTALQRSASESVTP